LDGLGKGLHYYPPLLMLIAEDLHLLGHAKISDRNLEHAFHNLDDGEGYISAALAHGEYYNAVSHADVVYRVLGHLEENPEAVPEFSLSSSTSTRTSASSRPGSSTYSGT
jgi:hypothetical protein